MYLEPLRPNSYATGINGIGLLTLFPVLLQPLSGSDYQGGALNEWLDV